MTNKNKNELFFNCNWNLFKEKSHWFFVQLNRCTYQLEFLCIENEGGVKWCRQRRFDEKRDVALSDASSQECYSWVGGVVNVLDAIDWISLWTLKKINKYQMWLIAFLFSLSQKNRCENVYFGRKICTNVSLHYLILNLNSILPLGRTMWNFSIGMELVEWQHS